MAQRHSYVAHVRTVWSDSLECSFFKKFESQKSLNWDDFQVLFSFVA